MAFSSWRTWVTAETVTAAHMNQEVRDNGEALFPDEEAAVSWTPDLEGTTNDASNMTTSGRRWRVGALQFVWVRFVFPASDDNNLSGVMFVTLPVAASGLQSSSSAGSGQTIGSWQGRDDGTPGNNEGGTVALRASDEVSFNRPVGGFVSATSPFTWDTDDVLTFHAVYVIA